MSDTTESLTFTLNGNTYPFTIAEQKERKAKGNKVTPALSYPVVDSTDVDVLGAFVTDLLRYADSKKPGNGREVFASLFHKPFKGAFVEVPNADSADITELWPAIIDELVEVSRQKVDLDAIGKEIIAEQSVLMQWQILPHDPADVVAAKTAAREAAGVDEDEFCRRWVAVSTRQIDWLKATHEAELKAAERSQKMREGKAKKAAAAAAAPAAAAPAN